MSGIYVHIPFCRKACHYCDFHFSTTLHKVDAMVEAIIMEAEIRADFLDTDEISTLYFGGGTPSILSFQQLSHLLSALRRIYNLDQLEEVTLEANPDDLTVEKLMQLKDLCIDRLSIGVQSFFQNDLVMMNRSHNSRQARMAIEDALKIGYEKISIDLIYAQPWAEENSFIKNIEIFNEYDLRHLSAYALTVEEKTALHFQIKNGRTPPISEEAAFDDFKYLQSWAQENNFDHYEISNLAFGNSCGIHNTNYWKGKKYIGLGPAAHSYDGKSRFWNVSNNQKYLKALNQGQLACEKETLSLIDQYNEYILTGLRTKWGINMNALNKYGEKITTHFYSVAEHLINDNVLQTSDDIYFINRAFWFQADGVARELFFV